MASSIYADKAALIEEELGAAVRERQLREQQALRERVAQFFDKRAVAGQRLQAALDEAVAAWCEVAELSGKAAAAWSWGTGDVTATVLDVKGLSAAVGAYVWKIGGVPPTTGGFAPPAGWIPSFPGARAPNFMTIADKEAIPKLVDVLEHGAAAARAILNGERAPTPVAVTELPRRERTPAQERISALLAEMNQLAGDPSQEARYFEIVREIEKVRANV